MSKHKTGYDHKAYQHWYYENVTKPKRKAKQTFKPKIDWSDREQRNAYQRAYRKAKKDNSQ